jgi:uncharacterized membrane protein YhhN
MHPFLLDDGHDLLRIGLIYLSGAAALGYLLFEARPAYALRPAVKACAVGPLALLAALALPAASGPAFGIVAALAVALLLSTVGDVLLALPGEGMFPLGLGAFLCGHVAFIAAFVPLLDVGAAGTSTWAALGLLVGAAVLVFLWLRPGLGALVMPVAAYFLVIVTMTATTFLGAFAGPWVAIGAVLFVVSDALIAIDRFRRPVPGASFAIWSTYYAAQVLIAWGTLHTLSLA